ncbi:MAG: glycyl radical protein [Deltaproteobacteria bacterium]|nr:glycyl radical protein [Deltaproteobacteria bacterium]
MGQTTAEVLSPQEERIVKGDDQGLTTKEGQVKRMRIHKMLKGFRDKKPRFGVDRALLVTESFKQTEGLPNVLRWAKAMQHVVKNIPISIGEDELFAGRCGPLGKYYVLYPELLPTGWASKIADKALNGEEIEYEMTQEDARIIKEEIDPYWTGRTVHDGYLALLPEETRNFMYQEGKATGVIAPTGTARTSLAWCLDYDKVMKRGFNGIKKEAQGKLAALDPADPDNSVEKLPFYKSVIITCDSIEILAKRYADLARQMAENEPNTQRKRELQRMAEMCDRVPMNPPASFLEAIQSQWMTQVYSRYEQNIGGVVGNGRIDQYLYPFYLKDKESGIITDDEVLEIFECLWLNMAQSVTSTATRKGSGTPHFETTTIGGQTIDGNDATNELSFLILQSKKEFTLDYPDLTARIHSQTPDGFLKKICELIKEGTGFPKLLNDEEIIELFLAKGASLDEARNYTPTGCTEVKMLNRDTYFTGGPAVNLGAIVEMALNQGKLRKFGSAQIGVKTKHPEDFKSFDDLWNAFKIQAEYTYKHAFTTQTIIDTVKRRTVAAPQTSALHDLCMKNGSDIYEYKINDGVSLGNTSIMGFGTALDSLAAVKKLVFEDRKITMKELVEALETNYEGKESMRQLCLNAPKYGNNEGFAEPIGLKIDSLFAEIVSNYTTINGGKLDYIYVPITEHVVGGARIGATPNGRKAGEALSEGISHTQGCDTKGPTTTLKSIASVKSGQYKSRAARLLNVKLSPQVVAGERGTHTLASLIRSWCDMKFWHLQFNILNSDTLREAQKNPSKYRNLIVRVAGYSAYFVDLSQPLQDEIINRTEHQII